MTPSQTLNCSKSGGLSHNILHIFSLPGNRDKFTICKIKEGLLPPQSGLIQNGNQLTPFFVLHTLQDMPGLSGFYMATIFSAGLSTV